MIHHHRHHHHNLSKDLIRSFEFEKLEQLDDETFPPSDYYLSSPIKILLLSEGDFSGSVGSFIKPATPLCLLSDISGDILDRLAADLTDLNSGALYSYPESKYLLIFLSFYLFYYIFLRSIQNRSYSYQEVNLRKQLSHTLTNVFIHITSFYIFQYLSQVRVLYMFLFFLKIKL